MKKDLNKKSPRSPRGKESYFTFSRSLQFVGIAIVIGAIYIAIKSNYSGIKNMINANQDAIKLAMTGDTPYLFYCNRGGKEDIYPIIFTDLNTKLGSKFGFASLNCSQTLPSGKTIFERFKLEPSWRPCIFGTAPWLGKPIQATPNHMRDTKAFSSFVEKYFYPRAREIGTDTELKKICGFGKPVDSDASEMSSIKNTCIVIVKGGRYSKTHSEIEERLIRHVPRAKVVKLDGTKKRLSIEDIEQFPTDSFAMKVYAVRQGTHYLEMTNPITWDYISTFISYSFATPLSAYSTLSDGKQISLLKIASIFKDRSSSQNRYQEGGSSGNSEGSKGKKSSSSSSSKKSKRSSSSSKTKQKDESKSEPESEGSNSDSIIDDSESEDEEVIEL